MADLGNSGFYRDTSPNFYPNPPYGTAYKESQRVAFASPRDVQPGRDARYPAYAAPMSDGRLVTDYRPQCARNIPPAYQYNSKLWMVHHADKLMQESRQRQAEWSGATLPMSNTVPPPADIAHSTPFYSEIMPTGVASGIGVERAGAKTPGLFGTFTFDSSMSELQNNRKNIELTTKYEGGRNTPRSSLRMMR